MAISARWRTFLRWFVLVYVVLGLVYLVLFDMSASALHVSAVFDPDVSWQARLGLIGLAIKIVILWPLLVFFTLVNRLG